MVYEAVCRCVLIGKAARETHPRMVMMLAVKVDRRVPNAIHIICTVLLVIGEVMTVIVLRTSLMHSIAIKTLCSRQIR